MARAGLLVGLVAALSPTATLTSASAASPLQVIKQALASVRIGSPGEPVGPLGPRVAGLSHVNFRNWSGYADDHSQGNNYQKVSANWHQPAVKCVRRTDREWAYFWLGIDGFSNKTVEQVGTLAFCNKGKVSYADWFEMYPAKPVVVSAIRAGDSISSSVHFARGKYRLTVTDHTHPAASFSRTRTCGNTPCLNRSAEWIVERPGRPPVVLPNFGRWRVTGAAVTSGNTNGHIGTFPHDAITMVDSSGRALVTASRLLSGRAFTTVWHRSA